MRDEDFEGFIEEFGETSERVEVPAAAIAKWRNILPNQLLQYWEAEGWSAYANGLIWIVDPDNFADIVDEWLSDTPLESLDRFHVIARTAFGKLFLWGEKTGDSIVISPYTNTISGLAKSLQRTVDDPDFYIRTFFGFLTRERCDENDENGRPLFERAFKKFGPVARDEVFAFEPALIVGGKMELSKIAKVDLDVHLTILRQLSSPELSFSGVDLP